MSNNLALKALKNNKRITFYLPINTYNRMSNL